MAWDDIPNSEIAVDADVDSLTFNKLKNRDQFLYDVMAGTDSTKIPAQAIATQTSGSGAGLTINQFNFLSAGGTYSGLASGATVDISTGVACTETRATMVSVAQAGTGVNCSLTWRLVAVVLAGSRTWYVRVTRGADGGANIDVNWRVRFVANS